MFGLAFGLNGTSGQIRVDGPTSFRRQAVEIGGDLRTHVCPDYSGSAGRNRGRSEFATLPFRTLGTLGLDRRVH